MRVRGEPGSSGYGIDVKVFMSIIRELIYYTQVYGIGYRVLIASLEVGFKGR